MNTKSKRINHEVAMQLGDPLPLPYKIGGQPQIKDEDDISVEPRHNSRKYQEPILYTRNISSSQNSDIYNPENLKQRTKTITLGKPRPIPLQRNYLSSRVISNEHLPKTYDLDEQLRLVDSISTKLGRIRQIVGYKQPEIDYESFQRFESELSIFLREHNEEEHTEIDEYIQQNAEPSVLDELENFQRVAGPDYTLRNTLIVSGILFFLISSFVVSGLNYEYCYYFC